MSAKKIFSFLFDALIVFWAACGVTLAFGFGALFAMARSTAGRKNPLASAAPFAHKARRLLSLIFSAVFKKH